jgi:ABC-2 type transport system permease protein
VSALRTAHAIVVRDLSRAVRQKGRLFGGLARSFMWLLLVAAGFGAITRVEGASSYQAFVFPGIVVMAALFGAMLTAISTVYDREFGMLRLMLASPAGIRAVLAGRAVAASAVGVLHGGIVLLTAPLFVTVTASQLASAAGALVAGAAASSVLGLLVAAPVKSVENFAAIVNVVLFPLLFLSGALYPTSTMPAWLYAAVRLNPVTYAVDLMRGALGQRMEFSAATSLAALGVAIVVAFTAAAALFDPELRLSRGGVRQSIVNGVDFHDSLPDTLPATWPDPGPHERAVAS